MPRLRLKPEVRKRIIIDAAVRVITDSGVYAVTHKSVAKECEVVTGISTVRHYYPLTSDILAAAALRDTDVKKRITLAGFDV